jgi:hypothetical protein
MTLEKLPDVLGQEAQARPDPAGTQLTSLYQAVERLLRDTEQSADGADRQQPLERPCARVPCRAMTFQHEPIVPPAQPAEARSDTRIRWQRSAAWRAGHDARVRARLGESQIFGDCKAAYERLFDYTIEARNDAIGINQEGLLEAAESILARAQRTLVELRSDEPLDISVASELLLAQDWARQAHEEVHGSPGRVKAFEIAAANGHPLAICRGSSITFDVSGAVADALERSGARTSRDGLEPGEVRTDAPGCLRIFEDSMRTSARRTTMWRVWCPEHTPNTGQSLRRWRAEMRNRTREWQLQIRSAEAEEWRQRRRSRPTGPSG